MNLFENLQLMKESDTSIVSEFKEFLSNKNAQYIANEIGETKDGMQIVIYDGDWKHEHLYMKHLLDEFFTNKGIDISITSEEIGESELDTYSARYDIEFNPEPKEYMADVVTEDVDTSNWKQRFKGMDVYISDKYPTYQIEKAYNGYGQEVWAVFKNDWTGSKHKRLFVVSSFEKAIDYIENGKTPRKPKALDNIEEGKHYGGAYDISDTAYFTRDDLDEFSNEVIENLSQLSHNDIIADVIECYLDEDTNLLELSISYNDNEYHYEEIIDMRKIKKPADLITKYVNTFVNNLYRQIEEDTNIIIESITKKYIKHYSDGKGHYISIYKNDADDKLYADGDIPSRSYTIEWTNDIEEYCTNNLGFKSIDNLNPKNINLSEYEYCPYGNGHDAHWELYRKRIKDAKTKWAAKHDKTGEIREITYDQALGYDLIDSNPIRQLSRDLGKILLP